MVCWYPIWHVDIQGVYWHQTKYGMLISNIVSWYLISILNKWYADIKLNMVYWHPEFWYWIDGMLTSYKTWYIDIHHGMLTLHFDNEYMVYWHQTKHGMLISNMVFCHWISILNIWYADIKLNIVCWYPTWYVDIEFR